MANNNGKKPERDYQQELTDKFIARIEEALASEEKGLKWDKPFVFSPEWPRNSFTGERYRGSNVAILMTEEFADPRWITFNQMQTLSKQTKTPLKLTKGSKASYIQKVIPAYEKDEEGNIKKDANGVAIPVRDENGKEKISFRYYPIFNCSQIEGIEPYVKPTRQIAPIEEVELLSEALQDRTGLTVEHTDQMMPYYAPGKHLVNMPHRHHFKSSEMYAAVLGHELGHSTGPALGRKIDGGFGSESYAKEELVAELTSSFMAVELGIKHNLAMHENIAAYLKSWLQVLKNDKTFIAKAAGQAGKAVDYQMEHLNAYKEELKLKQERSEKVQLELSRTEQKKKSSAIRA
jgi:antirestriction protein ArdC